MYTMSKKLRSTRDLELSDSGALENDKAIKYKIFVPYMKNLEHFILLLCHVRNIKDSSNLLT